MSKIEDIKKEKFERELREAEIYQGFVSSYNKGISYDTIYDMYDLDYDIYMKKLRYGYNFVKQTCIQDEYDLDRIRTAFLFFCLKLRQEKRQSVEVKTYYDKVLDEKEEIENVLKEGIRLDDYAALIEKDLEIFDKNYQNNPGYEPEDTATKTREEYKIRKLALELIKKENN